MTNSIVNLNVTTQNAPIPSTLQRSVALVSAGGTTAAAGSLTLYQSLAALAAAYSASIPISSVSYSSGTVTVTTTSPHGLPVGEVIDLLFSGFTPTVYNSFHAVTITGASTFTYPAATNPGSVTTEGVASIYSEFEILAMATTYFSFPNPPALYVLELGPIGITQAGPALASWINANPNTIYSFLLSNDWDSYPSTLSALFSAFQAPNKKTYFWCTTTLANIGNYATFKNVFAMVQTPITPNYEFDAAAAFAVAASYNPSSSNLVSPLQFSYLYGVTQYPQYGNAALFASFKTANLNYVGNAGEGGISQNCLFWGNLQDGNQFTYWYSVDWAQINLDLNLANEVINGSNSSINPLYYNQAGINRLQNRAAQVVSNAVTYGLANGQVIKTNLSAAQFAANINAGLYANQIVVNAEPYTIYTAENPSNYALGLYTGLSVLYIPQNGFQSIVINLDVTNLVS